MKIQIIVVKDLNVDHIAAMIMRRNVQSKLISKRTQWVEIILSFSKRLRKRFQTQKLGDRETKFNNIFNNKIDVEV